MNAESTKEEVPTTQESVTKKVSLEKSKAKDSFGELADDMSELYFEKLGEKPVSPTNSFVYDANNGKNGITNKHNTETGVYQTYTVKKYQEGKDKPSSHKR